MALVLVGDIIETLPSVSQMDASVPRARGQQRIAPGQRAHSCSVTEVLVNSTALGDVPQLSCSSGSAKGQLGTSSVPVDGGNRLRGDVAELEHSVVVGIPEVEATVQCH